MITDVYIVQVGIMCAILAPGENKIAPKCHAFCDREPARVSFLHNGAIGNLFLTRHLILRRDYFLVGIFYYRR